MSLLDLIIVLVVLLASSVVPLPGGVVLFSVCALIVGRVLRGERLA